MTPIRLAHADEVRSDVLNIIGIEPDIERIDRILYTGIGGICEGVTRLVDAVEAGDDDTAARTAAEIEVAAGSLGFARTSRVAGAVAALASTSDRVAYAANVARLMRMVLQSREEMIRLRDLCG